jgi:hypothetical protein
VLKERIGTLTLKSECAKIYYWYKLSDGYDKYGYKFLIASEYADCNLPILFTNARQYTRNKITLLDGTPIKADGYDDNNGNFIFYNELNPLGQNSSAISPF